MKRKPKNFKNSMDRVEKYPPQPRSKNSSMAAGEVYTLRIEGIAAGGAGLARREGRTVFVDGTAPGDTVAVRITETHRGWDRAELAEIISPSPDRVEPPCPHYGTCGGCSLQHLRYEAQLAARAAILKDAFIRLGGIVPPEPRVFPSAPWEYRNRMQFHCSAQPHRSTQSHRSTQLDRGTRLDRAGCPGEAPVGLRARKNEKIIPLDDCPVADPGIRRALKERTLLPQKDRFTVYARDGLFLSEGGITRGRTGILGRELTLDAGVFFQSNAAMLEILGADLRAIAGEADTGPMADLYCGVGTFAALLADMFPRADLVEENRAALALARENVRGEGREFFALRDTDWVRLKSHAGGRAEKPGKTYGFMVADPPRQGLSPALARWIAAEGPPLFAYISCDPATLARDSRILLAGGYGLSELRFYDFYPQTAHIESLAVFKNNRI
jgi:23S rRNA (uracil1939-C5)-methyltransferase